MHAAVLLAHGNNDNNVMTKNATAFYEAVKKQGLPHQFFFHQGGHGGAPPDVMVNRWFTQFLYGVRQRRREPAALVGRALRDRRLPAAPVDRHRRRRPTRRRSRWPTRASFPLGFTLTIPQTNASGTITSTTRVITNIAGNTLTLATRSRRRRPESPTARS